MAKPPRKSVEKPVRKPARKPPRKPVRKPVTGPSVKLPEGLVSAWRKTVVSMGRPGRGSKVSKMTEEQRYYAIVAAEAESVRELWLIFTSERERISRYLMNPDRQTVAYLLGFHLVNAARLWHGLTEAERRHRWCAQVLGQAEGVRVLDLGCGTGAMAQALAAFLKSLGFKEDRVRFELVDRSRGFLDAAEQNLSELGYRKNVRSVRAPLEDFEDRGRAVTSIPPEDVTMIALGYVWNELANSPKAQKALAEILKSYAAQPAIVVMLEPANERLARGAMELRDVLVSYGYHPLYPCPHTVACPMLERSRDWCYSEILWQRPAEASALDNVTGLDRSLCHGGVYMFATPAAVPKVAAPEVLSGVVVGRPSIRGAQGGAFTYLLCGADGELHKAKKTLGPIAPKGSMFKVTPPAL